MTPRTPGLATACLAAFSVMTAMMLSSAPSARAAAYGHGVLRATPVGHDADRLRIVASDN
jgi:hypothetical protein